MTKEGVWDFLEKEDPDIFCLQEIKSTPEQIDVFLKKEEKIDFFKNHNYHYWNPAERKGYSGTAVFSKKKALKEIYEIGDELDNEGRTICLEFDEFFLVNVYVPNSKPDLSRLSHRYEKWDKNLLKFLKKLEKKKPVILCGDLNVAHQEIDLKNPKANKTTKTNPGSNGFTDQERERFGDFIKNGFIDTFRFLHPEKIKYTWWSYRFNARKNNAGWRIDYFLISEKLKDRLKKAEIYDEVTGSDHCPVGVEINF